jgi:hypothetical protein
MKLASRRFARFRGHVGELLVIDWPSAIDWIATASG